MFVKVQNIVTTYFDKSFPTTLLNYIDFVLQMTEKGNVRFEQELSSISHGVMRFKVAVYNKWGSSEYTTPLQVKKCEQSSMCLFFIILVVCVLGMW